MCASWLFACWRVWPVNRRVVALAIAALVFVSLIVTASRGAVGVGFLLVLILALAWWPRWRAPLAASAAVVAIAAALLAGFGAEVVRKQMADAEAENVLAFRDGIWRMGLAAWEKYPWFGVGKDNYGKITHELVRGWRAEAGKDYDASRYVRFPHAHNLYVNTLAERGTVGLASLAGGAVGRARRAAALSAAPRGRQFRLARLGRRRQRLDRHRRRRRRQHDAAP